MTTTTTTPTTPPQLPATPPITRRRYVATVDQLRGRLAMLSAERARIPAPLLERWLGGALARVPLYVAAERSIMRAELDGRIDEVRRMLGDGKRGRANAQGQGCRASRHTLDPLVRPSESGGGK